MSIELTLRKSLSSLLDLCGHTDVTNTSHIDDSGVELLIPVGIREEGGKIAPFNLNADLPRGGANRDHALETHYVGEQEHVTQHLAQLVILTRHHSLHQILTLISSQVADNHNDEVSQTQLIADSQSVPAFEHTAGSLSRSAVMTSLQSPSIGMRGHPPSRESLPPSDPIEPSLESTPIEHETLSHVSNRLTRHSTIRVAHSNQDVEMLGWLSLQHDNRISKNICTDTQAENSSTLSSIEDPIESFPSLDVDQAASSNGRNKAVTIGSLECECGVTVSA